MKLLSPNDYQPRAAHVFDEVTRELARVLPRARVEHIGASSIPGSISKGDLDVCVIVGVGQMDAAIAAVEARGYVVKADTMRTPQLCMLVSPRTDLDLALQLIEAGSGFEDFLRFRDMLRADPELVTAYNGVKMSAAGLDENGYREAKRVFIEGVLGRAMG